MTLLHTGSPHWFKKKTPIYSGLLFPVLQMYNVTNLFEDIKALYKIAGFKGQPVCFLFTDAEVKEEAFLEYINQILMTGEVAGEQCCLCNLPLADQ